MSLEDENDQFELPETLPLLAVRDLVVFPYMIVPLTVARESSLTAIKDALGKDRLLFVASQRDPDDEDPAPAGLNELGTVGMIMRMRKLADGRTKVLLQGLLKARIAEVLREKPSFVVKVARVAEPVLGELSLEGEALMRTARELLEGLVKNGKALPADILTIVAGIADPGRLANLLASNLNLKVSEAQPVLEMTDPLARLRLVNEYLRKESALAAVQQQLQTATKAELSKSQREYYLREQLRLIQSELGERDERTAELEELEGRLAKTPMPPEARDEARKQLHRLAQMSLDSSEAAVVRTWLDWVLEVPWEKASVDVLDLARAAAVLDEDHYGLEKVKDRILEYLGVARLKGQVKGPILCFAGPPGVGKTSLGRSIARALGRSFVRVSLGGVRDEAEIRGHRRTYVGAMPGRLVQALKQAGTKNPVVLLDEIDKLGADLRGDPAAALLEVLDPEQNASFRDHYLNLALDLSQVLFVATANVLDAVPPPLRDRMEVIALSGYTEEDKLRIAKRFLVPRQLAEAGLDATRLVIPDAALKKLVRGYTREAGLRNFERQVGALCRKVARKVAEGHTAPVKVTPATLERLLGPAPIADGPRLEKNEVGQATGLAWTPAGGDVLQIEASAMKGKAGLILTGQLGEVMKESAQAALTFTRARQKELDIAEDFFATHEVHIHVPAGAIPKDGPSAGITMACALVSIARNVALRRNVAMTGEITLRGHVLPIGGLKEKVLAAARYGIDTVIVPEGNAQDLAEVPKDVRRKLKVVLARTIDDALQVALEAKEGEQ